MSHPEQKQSHNGSFAILPSFIMDNENLEEGAKILYARISMYSQDGRCWASNAHFAEKQKVTIRCIQKWLKQLVDNEYIEIELDKSGFQTQRNIWIIIDFKKNFTKRTTVHPPMNHSSPPHEPQFTHIISKQDNEDVHKDNVLENPSKFPKSIPKKTVTLSKDKKEILPATRRWRLTEHQQDILNFLRQENVDTDEKTLCYWAKTYSFERLESVLNAAKLKPRKSIGAYMNKLLTDQSIVENYNIKENTEFAKFYKKSGEITEMKIGKKFVTINFMEDLQEVNLNFEPEDFKRILMEKCESLIK
jgi:hypothetical protein